KQKGSGLGLATAFSIAKNHHGYISVESKLGEGTTFRVYLPASDQKVIRQPQEQMELISGKGKVLVMDDEAMVRQVLNRMLESLGYEAKFAKDGVEALELFMEAQQSGDTFAGVILDLTVPGSMGGKETMARLLKLDPHVKAIVSSGYSDDPIMADFKKFGFAGVIAKPYKISDLGKILNKIINGYE
ncbi:MAG: response regulator, partial [Desulfobaccales bacterium]